MMALAIACNNSLVFSGSWPATILDGRTDMDLPVTMANNRGGKIDKIIWLVNILQ